MNLLLISLNDYFIQQTGWLGPWEIAAIVVVVLLLFGGRKIPELMKGLGKGMKEFKEGIGNVEDKKDKEDSTSESKDDKNPKK
jgi:sec-independent protein translocase protein TatA